MFPIVVLERHCIRYAESNVAAEGRFEAWRQDFQAVGGADRRVAFRAPGDRHSRVGGEGGDGSLPITGIGIARHGRASDQGGCRLDRQFRPKQTPFHPQGLVHGIWSSGSHVFL